MSNQFVFLFVVLFWAILKQTAAHSVIILSADYLLVGQRNLASQKTHRNRQTSQGLTLLLFVVVDILGLLLGGASAYCLRFKAGLIPIELNYDPRAYVHFTAIAVPVWVFWLQRSGCYEFFGRAFNREIMTRITRACFKATLTFVAVHFFTRNLEISRLVYIIGFFGTLVGIGTARFVTDRALAKLRRHGIAAPARVAVLGMHPLGCEIADRVERHSLLGLRIVGFIRINSDRSEPLPEIYGKCPVLGYADELPQLIEQYSLDELIVNAPEMSADEIADLMLDCEKHLVTMRIAPGLLQHRMIRLDVEQIDGIPLYSLKQTPMTASGMFMKRLFDIIVAATLLVLLALPMAIIALVIRLTSPGPALYCQTRVSLDSREFTLYKFRSMVVNDGNRGTAPNDDRITPLGAFLRRSCLDELPQLWNVLCGDMSLVGPRPERPHLVEKHRERIPRYMGRLRVPAGMTGLAQINGMRQGTSLEDRIRYDIEYIENWSFWLDMKILFLTVFSFNRNAY